MKALFICPEIDVTDMIISAWELFNESAVRDRVDIMGSPRDASWIATAKRENPDVIFYIDGAGAPGRAGPDVLKALRTIAPSIHLCFDGGDYPWFPYLEEHKKNESFDLQVGITGVGNRDLLEVIVLTPTNYTNYENKNITKDISCGFSGGLTQNDTSGRTAILNGLIRSCHLTTKLQRPNVKVSYQDYADFLLQCHRGLNTAVHGSGVGYLMKMRILEFSLARTASIETTQSPARYWFPQEYIYFYETIDDVINIIENSPLDEVKDKADRMHDYVMKYYTPEQIYKEILAGVGL